MSDTSDTDNDNYENANRLYIMKKNTLLATRVVVVAISNYRSLYVHKQKKRTSILFGHGWVEELKRGNENRFFEQFRMRKHVFRNLVSELTQHFGLKPTQHVGVEEAVAMYMIGHGATYKDVEKRFQRSGETVWRQFNRVLSFVESLGLEIIKPADNMFREAPKFIEEDERYWPYFKDCPEAVVADDPAFDDSGGVPFGCALLLGAGPFHL
ncbi:hypothetical protein K1719_036153 [Acacia pycnantha]|nr:hypothetical protein K1719_036153 [Acacia pycnantha]